MMSLKSSRAESASCVVVVFIAGSDGITLVVRSDSDNFATCSETAPPCRAWLATLFQVNQAYAINAEALVIALPVFIGKTKIPVCDSALYFIGGAVNYANIGIRLSVCYSGKVFSQIYTCLPSDFTDDIRRNRAKLPVF